MRERAVKRARRIRCVSVGTLFLIASWSAAQSVPPPLTSNRPGIGDSEALVAHGAVQLEAGVQGQDAPPGDDRRWTQTWGQLTVRFGLRSRIELFAGWDGLSLDRVSAGGESRFLAGGND